MIRKSAGFVSQRTWVWTPTKATPMFSRNVTFLCGSHSLHRSWRSSSEAPEAWGQSHVSSGSWSCVQPCNHGDGPSLLLIQMKGYYYLLKLLLIWVVSISFYKYTECSKLYLWSWITHSFIVEYNIIQGN